MTRSAKAPLRICVDARLRHGEAGGVEQVVLGLAEAFSRFDDGDEEYLFLSLEGHDGWLAPSLRGACRPLRVRASGPGGLRASRPGGLRQRIAASFPRVARAYAEARLAFADAVPPSDGTVEAAGADVVHFTFQQGFRTRIPSIYHPHDLQHVHLPQFFSWSQRRWRDAAYRTLCEQAEMVAVASSWVKRDLMQNLGVPERKVHVVPLAPVVEHYPDLDAAGIERLRRKLGLPERFAFFPAQTWPHKNHVGLLEAIELVRERRGYTVPLVSSGRRNEYASEIVRQARRLSLEGALHLVGFVAPEELQALYRMARCVIIPSLFEAASFPLWEAFRNLVPAACSNVTSLPEQAGDAALVFDPRDVSAMAEALSRVWEEEPLRARLVEKGTARLSLFSMERTGRLFRAHYRRIAGRALSAEDVDLLGGPLPM